MSTVTEDELYRDILFFGPGGMARPMMTAIAPQQWWTVVPPALLALAALWFAALGGIGGVAMNCFDACHSNGPGMAVGVGAVPILGFAALTLLVTGLCVPAWREVVFAVLWAVFLLACGCAALVFTAAG
jgi:hypothetical protein